MSGDKIKTYFYIDGYNLYYQRLKESPYKWLDLQKLCESLLPKNDIRVVKYFTARAEDNPYDPSLSSRQNTYLCALKSLPKLEIIEGLYKTERKFLPRAEEYKFWSEFISKPPMVKVVLPKEKRTDVSLASHLVFDACNKLFDVAAIISADTDFLSAYEIVSAQMKFDLIIVSPDNILPRDLERFNSYHVKFLDKHLENSLLPPAVVVNGKTYTKPPSW